MEEANSYVSFLHLCKGTFHALESHKMLWDKACSMSGMMKQAKPEAEPLDPSAILMHVVGSFSRYDRATGGKEALFPF